MTRHLTSFTFISLLGSLAFGCGGGSSGGGGSPPPPAPAAGQPIVTLSTTRSATYVLDLTVVEGSSPPDQLITVFNDGAGTLAWTATASASWITPSPSLGSDNDAITLSFDTSLLSPGFYAGDVFVSDPNAQFNDQVTVFLCVLSGSSPGLTKLGATDPIRVDGFTTSVPPASLQDQLDHLYQFPGVAGTSYSLALDTTPSGMPVLLEVVRIDLPAETLLVQQVVMTPYATTLSLAQDGPVEVRVFDHLQANLTLSTLNVTPTTLPFSPDSFDVVIHFVGDSPFTGLLGDPVGGDPFYNDLTNVADLQNFAADLVAVTNAKLAPAGIQIGNVAFQQLSNAQASAAHFSLFDGTNGVTRTPDPGQGAVRNAVGALGVDISDPTYGRALDVFVMHSGALSAPDTNGLCDCSLAPDLTILGGVFAGRGSNHHISIRLFDGSAGGFLPRTVPDLGSSLAHEIGHFLTMHHTANQGAPFRDDGFPDTPIGTDFNGNGLIDFGEDPDRSFVMFAFTDTAKFQWSQQQITAMRRYLATRDH